MLKFLRKSIRFVSETNLGENSQVRMFFFFTNKRLFSSCLSFYLLVFLLIVFLFYAEKNHAIVKIGNKIKVKKYR